MPAFDDSVQFFGGQDLSALQGENESQKAISDRADEERELVESISELKLAEKSETAWKSAEAEKNRKILFKFPTPKKVTENKLTEKKIRKQLNRKEQKTRTELKTEKITESKVLGTKKVDVKQLKEVEEEKQKMHENAMKMKKGEDEEVLDLFPRIPKGIESNLENTDQTIVKEDGKEPLVSPVKSQELTKHEMNSKIERVSESERTEVRSEEEQRVMATVEVAVDEVGIKSKRKKQAKSRVKRQASQNECLGIALESEPIPEPTCACGLNCFRVRDCEGSEGSSAEDEAVDEYLCGCPKSCDP